MDQQNRHKQDPNQGNQNEQPQSERGRMDSCKELRPANVYDVAANETWLEEMARQGWHLSQLAEQNTFYFHHIFQCFSGL